MRYVWLNTVAATALALGVATAGAQVTDKEPKGPGQGQQVQGSEPTQKDKAAPSTRGSGVTTGQSGAPRQVGPGATGQASPKQQEDRGTAQTQDRGTSPGAKERELTTKEPQDQRPRAQELKSQERKARGEERRERATTKEQEPRGQVREDRAGEQKKQPGTAQQRQDRKAGEADGTRTREQTGRTETQARTSGKVELSSRQETTIQQTFRKHRDVNVIRDRDIDFSISVGATIPRSVRLAPLPPAIIEVVPQFRGYRYVVVEDEIVIVHPRTFLIVAVIPYEGAARASVRTGTRVSLSAPQRQRILSYAQAECDVVLAEPDFRIAVGVQIPRQIELCPFEDVVVQEVDVVRPYRFFVVRNQVVLVDPSDYTIIEVIR